MKMMKFSELVQCWGQQPETLQRSEDQSAGLEVTSGARKPAENAGRGSRNSVVWRPSLGAISEDKAATAVGSGRSERTEKPRKEVPVKGRSQKASKFRARDDRDRYGQIIVPAVIPALTPTAFLF
ncbi:uncharacterized protein [Aristolochia californica]|uniref:uncharacterized protein n=1 Tax=Aristolochia californica TaxID=171875 RepID=UPI0035DD0EC4